MYLWESPHIPVCVCPKEKLLISTENSGTVNISFRLVSEITLAIKSNQFSILLKLALRISYSSQKKRKHKKREVINSVNFFKKESFLLFIK